MAFNLEMIVSARAHVQSSNMHRTKTHLKVPNGGNNVKTSYESSSVEERDLSHGFSGRHFSPSLPGDRHLKLSSQIKSDHRAEISGNIARRVR